MTEKVPDFDSIDEDGKIFIRIRDIGKPNPNKARFVQTGVAGNSLRPVGYMQEVPSK